MEVLILVCSLAVTAPDCSKENAQNVFFAPSVAATTMPVGCLHEGMQYAAQSNLVTPGTYAKIVCRRPLTRREARRMKVES